MIGLFDSGHGGLTVQRVLEKRFPLRDFVYLGDHRQAPYGAKSAEHVLALTRRGVERLFDEGCRLVIIACNSAAAIALRRLQQDWLARFYPEHRILGVIVPVVEAVTQVPWSVQEADPNHAGEPMTVGVFGTRHTVKSDAFRIEISKRAPAVSVVQQACPKLAGAIEADASESELSALVERYAAALSESLGERRLDAVVLGCTHYPLVGNLFERSLPRGVKMVSQPDLVTESLAAYLRRHPEFDRPSAEPSSRRRDFLTSGDPDLVGRIAQRFLGHPVVFRAA
ncbi:glutamate racemase [Algihabitans albus]|uniref:glutamate racemase n=1 Tax=Algihabitans albus TaxID=2164067 RepID=UPI000E5C81CF|nr:aspartate/glutamate racemase family protein [Algihabitans albus]